jgi:hypothetical protein
MSLPSNLLQLLGRNRQILTVSYPGFDLIAQACLLELGDDRGEPALTTLAENFAEHGRDHSRLKLAERSPELGRVFQRIENSHGQTLR